MNAKILGLKPEEMNPQQFGGMCSRAIPIKAEDMDNVDAGIQTIATTSQPAIVLDWSRWEFVREVLPMKYCELPNPNKVPLLDAHSRWSVTDIKGSAKDFRVAGNQLLCNTFISSSEEDIRTKVKEKHIDSVSIGYMTDQTQTVEVPQGKAVTVDGVAYTNDYEDGIPFLVRTWWGVKELSMVPIGADDKAKFKALNGLNAEKLVEQMSVLKNEIDVLKQNLKPNQESTEPTTKIEEKTKPVPAAIPEKTEPKIETLKVNKAEYEKWQSEKYSHMARLAIQKEIDYQKGLVS